ncbi:hypothetical protein GCM10010289_75290 [Streptomyces violascens]|nr:hypothetical protein GCM10010289_75290 [Streptomyces violascens]
MPVHLYFPKPFPLDEHAVPGGKQFIRCDAERGCIRMEFDVTALQVLEEPEPELGLFPCCGTC